MPRRLNGNTGGIFFHVMNRGVRKLPLFMNAGDYGAFFKVMCEAAARTAMRVIAIALMPNHWHLVLWPYADGDLTRYTGWLSLTHVARWHRAHGTRGTGSVYQGPFKAIPVEPGLHLYRVIRYVEQNPLRAKLVTRAEDWPWSSASIIAVANRPELHPWPMEKPANWLDIVNEPERDVALATLRECVMHSSPYGNERWRKETASQLSWTKGMRPVGRPFKGISPGLIVPERSGSISPGLIDTFATGHEPRVAAANREPS